MSNDKRQPASALDPDTINRICESHRPADVPRPLASQLRNTVLERIAKHARQGEGDDALTRDRLQTIRADAGDWHAITPKHSVKILNRDPETGVVSFLFRLAPGASIRSHAHDFDEECLVLEGDLSMPGLDLKAGDYHLAPKGVDHQRMVTQHGALLFLRGQDPLTPQQATQQ